MTSSIKQQCANIPAHLNENGIGSSPDTFFRRVRKVRSGDETRTKGPLRASLKYETGKSLYGQILFLFLSFFHT